MDIELASFGRASLFLGIPFVLLVFYLQWKWAKTCKHFIRILVVEQSGGGRWDLAPKSGGEISIKNPRTNTIRTWPINELATIDVLYPGVGFLPGWMQKTIRLAIVDESDWEVLLNRSAHQKKVASPDIVQAIKDIALKISDEENEVRKALLFAMDGVSTAPTREMIASPAVLGNLVHEKITEVVATVARDIFEPLKEIMKKLGKPVNPIIVYGGLILVIVLVVYSVYQSAESAKATEEVLGMAKDIALIKQSLGVAG